MRAKTPMSLRGEMMNQQALSESAKAASPYLPRVATIAEMKPFTEQEMWYRLELTDGQGVEYSAGQFMELGLFGVGEAPISICSAPGKRDDLEMCIRAVGDVTDAVGKLNVGEQVGLRGPFGNGFDMDAVAGKDLLFVAGGLGLAPCRSFILEALAKRDQYHRVTILYGARSPKDLLFTDDLARWAERKDCEPIMFKFAVLEGLAMGMRKANIYCSLERRMKCGLGKCGHCQIRNVYVCQEGPIFSYAEVMRLREGI